MRDEAIEVIEAKYAIEHGTDASRPLTLGEMMEIMFKKKLNLEHLDVEKWKSLSQKVYKMMRTNPAEVYRILTQ
jgi:hypothetical protein